MCLDKIKLAELVTSSLGGKQLTEKETEKMLEALWKKYWKQGLDSFQEKVVLSSHICFPDSREERGKYTREALARLTRKT